MSKVGDYGFSGSFILVIGQIEFICRSFYDLGNFSVMDMADIRIEVMLYLMVQTPCKPIHQLVFRVEIYRCEQLMYGPSILHGAIFIGHWGFGIVHNMGQLKDYAKNYPGHIVHHKETQKDFPPSNIHKDQWQYDPNGHVQ